MNMILGAGAGIVKNYSDKQITNLMDNVYASQENQNYMRELDYEYDEYKDYDVYNDYRGGPNYRDDKGYLDVKSGTVFDAEDEEDYSTTTTSTPVSDYTPTTQAPAPVDNTDYGVAMGGPAYDY